MSLFKQGLSKDSFKRELTKCGARRILLEMRDVVEEAYVKYRKGRNISIGPNGEIVVFDSNQDKTFDIFEAKEEGGATQRRVVKGKIEETINIDKYGIAEGKEFRMIDFHPDYILRFAQNQEWYGELGRTLLDYPMCFPAMKENIREPYISLALSHMIQESKDARNNRDGLEEEFGPFAPAIGDSEFKIIYSRNRLEEMKKSYEETGSISVPEVEEGIAEQFRKQYYDEILADLEKDRQENDEEKENLQKIRKRVTRFLKIPIIGKRILGVLERADRKVFQDIFSTDNSVPIPENMEEIDGVVMASPRIEMECLKLRRYTKRAAQLGNDIKDASKLIQPKKIEYPAEYR